MRGTRVVLLWLLVLSLSGCFGKDNLSDAEMEQRARDALIALETDIGPDGDIHLIEMTGSITVEAPTPAGMFPVSVQASATLAFGPDGEVRVDGKVARIQYSVYCDPERIVVVTDGFEDYGENDEDFESRNPAGVCTGRHAEPLLTGLGDLDFADPALLTGRFDPDALELVSVEKTGKKTFDATYRSLGTAGATDITIHLKGKSIQSFTVENPESRLTLTPERGDRIPQAAPIASDTFAGTVRGTTEESASGYQWTGTQGAGGALDTYAFRVYADGGNMPCSGGPTPTVTFDLANGDVQSDGDWRFTFQDDGDGTLGEGDWAFIQHPGRGSSPFDATVLIWDNWADSQTSPGCSIPGPGATLSLIGVISAAALAMVRRRI